MNANRDRDLARRLAKAEAALERRANAPPEDPDPDYAELCAIAAQLPPGPDDQGDPFRRLVYALSGAYPPIGPDRPRLHLHPDLDDDDDDDEDPS